MTSFLLEAKRLLLARRKRPRRRRAAEKRDEIALFPLMEMHPIPHQPGPSIKDTRLDGIGQ
jgi:hypothetical protein